MELAFKERTVRGKKMKKLREEGLVPVVCYGGKEEGNIYSVEKKEFLSALNSNEVMFEGKGELEGKLMLLQEIVYHPVKGDITHADFLFVDEKHKVEHEVPLHFINEAPAVKVHGGNMIIVTDTVTVEAFPQNIPTHIDIDVSTLEHIGDHITVNDIPGQKDVIIKTSPDNVIVSIVEQSQEKENEENEVRMEDIEAVKQKGDKGDATQGDDTAK